MAAHYFGDFSYFFKLVEKGAWSLHRQHEAGHFNAIRLHGAPGADFAARLEAWATVDFLRNYQLIEALGRYHGFTYQVFLQPESVLEDDRFLSPHDIAVKRTTEAGYGADAVALMKEARRLFRALSAKHRIPYTEIGAIATPATSDEKLYVDHVHLMPGGARVAAKRMLPVVLERVRRQIRVPTLQPGRAGASGGGSAAHAPRRPLSSTPTPLPLGAGGVRRRRCRCDAATRRVGRPGSRPDQRCTAIRLE
jgi:hypothetical protein